MPLSMDDLDDLFTDNALVLPQTIDPVAGLLERVDELRSSGCCQKIAWSSNGCVAYVTADGREIRLATIRYDSKNGIWDQHIYTDARLKDHLTRIYQSRELTHISWSPSGNELAVSDGYGRLSIFNVFTVLNRLVIQKAWPKDSENHLNALVGLMWLNTKRNVFLYHYATRQDNTWNYAATQHDSKGPYNSIPGKLALVAMTRGGCIRLAYQTPDSLWQDTKEEIDGFSTSADLLTHAAFCPDKEDSLLLVVYTVGRQLRLYRITIDWQQLANKEQPSSLRKINFQHLHTIDDCCPAPGLGDPHRAIFTAPYIDAQLSHLELLPQEPRSKKQGSPGPMVLVTFSHLSNHYSTVGARDQAFSVVSRWEIRGKKPTLHSSFDQLASKKPKSNTAPKETLMMHMLEDIHIDGTIVQVLPLHLGTLIAISYSDGRVEFRERSTLKIRQLDTTPETVSSLLQVGFSLRDSSPCLHVALSPNVVAKTFFGSNHELKLAVAEVTFIESLQDHSFIERARTAFVLLCANAAKNNLSENDFLMSLHHFTQQLSLDASPDIQTQSLKVQHDFMSEVYKTLGVRLDQPADAQTENSLLRHPTLQRCLSFQATLGFRTRKESRSLTSKLAWSILNLRLVSLTFAFAFMKIPHGTELEMSKPDVLQNLIGLSNWSMVLNNYIVDQLLELNRLTNISHSAIDFDTIKDKVATVNSPALLLLIMSISRTFLKYNCRGLRGLELRAAANINAPPPPSDSPHSNSIVASSRAITRIFMMSHVSARQIEQLLVETESLVRHAYDDHLPPLTDAQRQDVEKRMLVTGQIPDILQGVVAQVLGRGAEKLRGEVREGELYFEDFSVLGLGDDERGRRWAEEHALDDIRKVIIAPGERVRVRVCARCGSVMEDIVPLRGSTVWMNNLQQKCFCGGVWIYE